MARAFGGQREGAHLCGPGGKPDGTYIDDYEFTGQGDLVRYNGMTVDG